MIISLDEAQKLDKSATEETCDGLEIMIRKLTNNNFQVVNFRCEGLILLDKTIRVSDGRLDIFKVGDTIEINGTHYNDGLYTVKNASVDTLTVDGDFISEVNSEAILTLVRYPSDVLSGVKKLLAYDAKMADKIGIKSEFISRWSVTYYDVTSSETEEGYPSSLLGFLKKYRKIRWS
ncbi:hypothetical protein ACVRY7_07815 [Streptococcus ictaluri]|uniref:Uncharacterized protein n=1 Tax=Streptococcus ictaluri 707-05 TaxID=764299 RepID=G5K3R5_9STRE|nr:hypothetical protein [Streptococcus ictaluri]EHI69665.1 hypothetical protein STRIC_1436 [Streptococcus ictaluri 707-05]QBX25533.1 hypothetical protein Javan262_0018 [Streptococcus phage Javan262]